MILPERVAGSTGATSTTANAPIGPTLRPTAARRAPRSGSLSCSPAFSTTKTYIPCPFTSCGMPTTAASATPPCADTGASTSAVPMRWPDTLITSSTRPVIQ